MSRATCRARRRSRSGAAGRRPGRGRSPDRWTAAASCGHRAGGQRAADEPHHEDALGQPEQAAGRPIERAQEAVIRRGGRGSGPEPDPNASPRPTMPTMPTSTTTARIGGSSVSSQVCAERQQDEDRQGARRRSRRPGPPSCGNAPDAMPATRAKTRTAMIATSTRFTGSVSRRPPDRSQAAPTRVSIRAGWVAS